MTKQPSDDTDSATGRRSEIEVTPEMIEAGACVLERELGGAVTSFWSAPDLAAEVFRAMALLRFAEPPRYRSQSRAE